MTKKKALKMIMSFGYQRNEAVLLLQDEHNSGKTNQQAVEAIRSSLEAFSEKLQECILRIRMNFQPAVDALNKMAESFRKLVSPGGNEHENPCD
ncbi:MAG: hypothetical protein IKH57_25840 [Clostridia bacterium]|nr:hypothetical protein [Clostridia bacterium]